MRRLHIDALDRTSIELGLALIAGVLLGGLLVISANVPALGGTPALVLVIVAAFLVVVLLNNLERLVLFAVAVGLPLNLDIALIISPYARYEPNLIRGNRTIVALTQLQVSFILIVVIVGYVLWLVEQQDGQRRRIHLYPRTTIPALALILVSILSVAYAQDTQLAIFKIAQLFELFLIYLYMANHIRTKGDLHFFVTVLMAALLAESVLMIVQWATGWGFSIAGIHAEYDPELGRAPGTLGHANVAGGIIAAQLVITAAMIWLFPRRSQKAFAVAFFVVGCIAMITTGSRAAWGSFVAAILGFILVGLRRGWIKGRSLLGLLALSMIMGGILYRPIVNRLTSDDRGSAESRPKMFRLAWNVIDASPSNFLLGVGANNYALIAAEYNTADVGDLGFVIDSSVHNAYLLHWAETGLAGLFVFLTFLASPFLRAWTHVKSGSRFISVLALGLACALAAVAIQMLVDPFITRSFNVFLWLLVSLIVSLDNVASRESGSPAAGQT